MQTTTTGAQYLKTLTTGELDGLIANFQSVIAGVIADGRFQAAMNYTDSLRATLVERSSR